MVLSIEPLEKRVILGASWLVNDFLCVQSSRSPILVNFATVCGIVILRKFIEFCMHDHCICTQGGWASPVLYCSYELLSTNSMNYKAWVNSKYRHRSTGCTTYTCELVQFSTYKLFFTNQRRPFERVGFFFSKSKAWTSVTFLCAVGLLLCIPGCIRDNLQIIAIVICHPYTCHQCFPPQKRYPV